MTPLSVTCPACLVTAGRPCMMLGGNRSGAEFHQERIDKVARTDVVPTTDEQWKEAVDAVGEEFA